jgi:hypothetical protein
MMLGEMSTRGAFLVAQARVGLLDRCINWISLSDIGGRRGGREKSASSLAVTLITDVEVWVAAATG